MGKVRLGGSFEEADGFKVLLDLQKHDRAEAVAALEAIVARLKQ